MVALNTTTTPRAGPARHDGETPIVHIQGLYKEFCIGRAARCQPVLRDVNLVVHPGETVGLVGGSGCGKSTILRLIAGLDVEKTSGSVLLNGRSVQGPSLSFGLVFQEPRLFPWLTVHENIAFSLRGGDKSNAEIKQIVDDHIALVGLSGFEHATPNQLSGGMAQRTSIARTLVNKPDILLLDEPFGALDAFTRIAMQDQMLEIRKRKATTMVLVTHDIDEAVFLCDRIVVLSKRPGTVRTVYHIDLPYRRERHSHAFVNYTGQIFEEFFNEVNFNI